jgi:hypothetical protein
VQRVPFVRTPQCVSRLIFGGVEGLEVFLMPVEIGESGPTASL